MRDCLCLKKKVILENFWCFSILFALLAFRCPADLFTPYLWAEDGAVLIQESIYKGISVITRPENGAYWIIQRIFGLFCYGLVMPFESIEALPYIMQVLAKALNVLCVMYFMSERFSWLVSKKAYRFGICAGIILFMSKYAIDTLTCETSLPFGLFFGVFLIGLELLCGSKYKFFSTGQTVFLTLMSLSIASAPCIGVLAGTVACRWIFYHCKTEKTDKRQWIINGTKLGIIVGAVAVQTNCILSSGRTSSEWEILNRLLLNTKSFMFFPYWNQFHTWSAFFTGTVLWILILYMTHISWKVVIYSGGFSYCYMLYCSMVDQADHAYTGYMTARYVFTCFEISAFMIGIAVVYLCTGKYRLGKYLAGAIGLCFAILALRTYDIPAADASIANAYKIYSGVFERKGRDHVWIPIGPFRPWKLNIPADISGQSVITDLEFGVEDLDEKRIGTEGFGVLRNQSNWDISGWAKTDTENQIFKRLFIKNGSDYLATTELTVRELFQSEKRAHTGFRFNVSDDAILCFEDGITTLELVGQTEDGVWHKGTLDIPTILPK